MSEPIIQIRNVTKRFGNMVAVDNVSLDIVAGEFFVMLGPSAVRGATPRVYGWGGRMARPCPASTAQSRPCH